MRPDSQTRITHSWKPGKTVGKNKKNVIDKNRFSNTNNTYWCLTKLTLTPGSLENPGQIVSLGVPRVRNICKI